MRDATITSMTNNELGENHTLHVRGLQNLYSAVRTRPAPPPQTLKSHVISGMRAVCSRSRKLPKTAPNGEVLAKKYAPSDFRPTLAAFRPTFDAGTPVFIGAPCGGSLYYRDDTGCLLVRHTPTFVEFTGRIDTRKLHYSTPDRHRTATVRLNFQEEL